MLSRRQRIIHAPTGPGFSPEQISSVSSWLNVTSATVTDSGVSSLPDLLVPGSPATQPTDSFRPPRVAAGNGRLVMQGLNDTLAVPPHAGNNSLIQWGFACHIALDDTTVQHRILRVGPGTANDPVATDSHAINVGTTEAISFTAYTDALGTASYRATTGAGVIGTSYIFLTVEVDLGAATDADRCVITIDTVIQGLTFGNQTGTPNAFPAALQGAPSELALMNRRTNASSFPVIGRMGPNIYFLNAKMPGATLGLLTPEARTALADFERPL